MRGGDHPNAALEEKASGGVGIDWSAYDKAPKNEAETKRETNNNEPRLQKVGGEADPVSHNERVLRDALDDHLRKSGMEVIGTDEGQRVLDMANGEDVKKMSFGEPYDYEKYPLGRVEPNLANRTVEIVNASSLHGFANYKEAYDWGVKNLCKTYTSEETGEKGFVEISPKIIDKYISKDARNASSNEDLHYAVLKVVPQIIKNGIDVEPHPNFAKKNGRRIPENGHDKNVLVHRVYAAVSVDGQLCRIKITMKENLQDNALANKPYSYEVEDISTEIESLEPIGDKVNDNQVGISNNSISAAKLLKDVEMSYNPSVKVLDESRKRSETVRKQKVYHGSGAYFDHFDHSHMGEGEGAQAYGWGTYVTEVEGIGRHYAKVGFLSAENKKMEEDDPIVLAVGEIIEREKQNRQVVPFEQRKVSAISELETYVKSIEEALAKETDAEDIAFYKKELARSKASLDILKPMTEKQYVDERLRQERMRHLYTAEIPDDNGSNYLQWNRLYKDDVLYSLLNKIGKALEAKGVDLNKDYNQKASWNTWIERLKIDGEAWTPNVATGEEIYEKLSKMLGENAYQENQEKASQILADAGFTGIKYPADYMRSGREDGKKNYVIFNEEDAKITGHVRFFRTKDGEAYGFTVGGRIYYDPRIATSETLVHEYAHLWASALRGGNAEERKNVVGLMKGTSVWDEVKRLYPELKDDEIADEVIAQYSGRRGAERLREEAKKIADGDVYGKAEAISAMEKIRRALSKFWKGVCDMLHIHYTSAEEVADRVMKDLLDGVAPRKFGKTDGRVRMHENTDKATNIDKKKALHLIEALQNHPETTIRSEELSSAAKVVENFEKPKGAAENVAAENVKFRLLEDDDPKAQELEALPDSELVPVYRNVQAFEDDALGSPMAFTDAETGERRELQGQKWNYSNPPEVKLTEEQQRQLDDLNKNGYIMVDGKKTTELQINDGLKFVKPKTKEAQLQYFLKKNPEDKGLWAAYDPYDHAIETPLNTQFGEAYKRPNLVVVRSLIPKSEIDEPFKADYALLPTGAHQWNNGRTLYLSRWSKIDKVLTREEEAKLIDEYWKKNPGKREALKSHRDYNRFVPQVRRELEKMGYRFELDGKELSPEESLAVDERNWESRDVIPGREGNVPFVSNEDIKRINAKMSGKWVGEPKEAMENAMTDRVNELAERLHTPVRIIRTDEEVAALPSARQRRMKGSFNPMTGEVTIVVPNNANLADVENTFIHEVVGHDGLRVLFPEEEKLNNALDELYRVSNEGIRQTIDRMAQKMYDAEVDRLREKKRREHEAKGEDANAHYYADMAEAHVEASKKREQFKRDATEEYGADLAGRIGESGFEKMSAEEQTFWGKLKSILQKALAQLLEGLKIPGKRKWSDKDWAFVLHEAYKRKKNDGRPGMMDVADTYAMREKTGYGEVKFSDGRNSNEPQPIGRSTFGSVYNQFKGKVLQAVKFLTNHESGDLLGVFHRKDIGDIDMVWGDDSGGLCHILNKHINDKDFPTVKNLVSRIDDIIP